MKRNKLIIRFFLLFLFAISLSYVAGQTNVGSQTRINSFVTQKQVVSSMASGKEINFVAILKIKNLNVLNQKLKGIYNPSSKKDHKFLSSSEIRKKFYFNKTEIETIEKEFRKEGFKVKYEGGLLMRLSANVTWINSKLGVSMRYFKKGNSSYFGSLKQAQVPKVLRNKISSFGGLNNFTTMRPFIKISTLFPKEISSDYSNGTAPFSPADIQKAYNYTPLYNEGINGTGVTVAIVDAYGSPTIREALGNFSNFSNLPSAKLNIFYPYNSTPIPNNSRWATETMLDVEWVHAIAPSATIDLVIVKDSTFSELLNGVYYVTNNLTNASVISLSWGGNEADFNSTTLTNLSNNFFQFAKKKEISVFVSSGDCGAFYTNSSGVCNTSRLSTNFPASSPYVTAVGGTTLNLNSLGDYNNETAWNLSGGGVSGIFSKPHWQIGLGVPNDSYRNVPDVSFDANPASGVFVIINGSNGSYYYYQIGGTSLSAPLWAGTAALINQKINGRVGLMNKLIYQLANSTDYSRDFHDVTFGNNSHYNATKGYDLTTGVGSPIAYNFVNDFSSFFLPFVKIFSPTNKSYYNVLNLTLNYTATDANLDKVWFNYNGTNTTLNGNTTFAVSNNQTSTLTLYANDTIGNINSTNVTFKIISLKVVPTSPLNESIVLKKNQTFGCNSSSGISLSNVTFNLWNSSGFLINSTSENITGTNNSSEVNFNNLIYGNYSWGCLVKDASGNSFSSLNFSLKRRYFLMNLTFPQNNSFTNKTDLNFSCEVNSSNNLANLTFDLWNSSGYLINSSFENVSGDFNSTNFTYNFSNSSEGTNGSASLGLSGSEGKYFWNCKAQDNLGNYSFFRKNYSFIYDKTKPNVNLITPSKGDSKEGNSVPVTFKFNVTDENLNSCSLIINGNFSETSGIDISGNHSFNKTLAPRIYNWTISCSDKAGNFNNLVYRILTIKSSPIVHSGGGGGGGSGGGSSPVVVKEVSKIPKSINILEKDLGIGVTKILIEKEILKFRINNKTNHTIKIDSIKNSSVTLEIHSNKTLVTLKIGESKKLNLSSKNYYDLYIKLNSIINQSVNLTLKVIREQIRPISFQPKTNPTIVRNQTKSSVKNSLWFPILIILLFLLVLIKRIISIKKARKERKSKKKKKV